MATYEDIEIDQGADVAIELHMVNLDSSKKDLTDHTVAARMRKSYSATNYTQFSTIVATPTTEGISTLTLTNTETDNLDPGRYVYDVEISFVDSDGETIIERVLEGRVLVKPSATY